MDEKFRDRVDAGQKLARRLLHYAGRQDVVVLGLPRGGVPVANEIAAALGAPLDVWVVRKLGVPGEREWSFGAVASGGVRVLNDDVLAATGLSEREIAAVTTAETAELIRREHEFRGPHPRPELRARIVILVDDGIATGATMRAAVRALRGLQPAAIVLAAPVASPEALAILRDEVDEIVVLVTPQPLVGIGLWYRDFTQVPDAAVRALLDRSARLSA